MLYRVFYFPGHTGFLPSTVCSDSVYVKITCRRDAGNGSGCSGCSSPGTHRIHSFHLKIKGVELFKASMGLVRYPLLVGNIAMVGNKAMLPGGRTLFAGAIFTY